MKEVLDEILEGEPLYDISDADGNLIQSKVKIEMVTPVIQTGTPLNKKLFDEIKGDLDSTYRNIPKGSPLPTASPQEKAQPTYALVLRLHESAPLYEEACPPPFY